ncbi:MAG: hypothetical protein AAFU70_06300, partial [Planctomycetota bacterium]
MGGAATIPGFGIERRRDIRYSYHATKQRVEIADPIGRMIEIPGRVIELSAGGAKIQCKPFVYSARKCSALLVDRDGGTMIVEGETIACDYLPDRGHVVRIKFSHRLDPADFIADSVMDATRESGSSGTALLVSSGTPEAIAVTGVLEALGMEVMTADTLVAARARFQDSPIDTFIDFAESPASAIAGVVRSMRGEGFDGPVVVFPPASLGSPELRSPDLGEIVMVPDASDFDAVAGTLEEVITSIEFPTSEDPLHSGQPGDDEATDDINQDLVIDLKRAMAEAQRAFLDGRMSDALRFIRKMIPTAGALDVDAYTKLLVRIEQLFIDNSGDPTRLRDPMRKALHMTARLRT